MKRILALVALCCILTACDDAKKVDPVEVCGQVVKVCLLADQICALDAKLASNEVCLKKNEVCGPAKALCENFLPKPTPTPAG